MIEEREIFWFDKDNEGNIVLYYVVVFGNYLIMWMIFVLMKKYCLDID